MKGSCMSKKAAVTAVTEIKIEITKKASCLSLSGQSEICYERGIDSDGKEYLRLTSSTGKGFFNKHWIAMSAIEAVLNAHPAGEGMSSKMMAPLYRGSSANSKGFLYAVVLNEGICEGVMPAGSPEVAGTVSDSKIRRSKESL